MIRFTAEDSSVSIKQLWMQTYCRCKLCGHQWSISGDVKLKECPSCRQEGKKDVAMGYVPDWWTNP